MSGMGARFAGVELYFEDLDGARWAVLHGPEGNSILPTGR